MSNLEAVSPAPASEAQRRTRRRGVVTGGKAGSVSGRSGARSATRTGRTRITISLSQRSMRSFDELKRLTDADTDSEVFRNALRLHHALINAHLSGDTFFIRRSGQSELVAIALFAESDPQDNAKEPKIKIDEATED